MLDLFGTLVDAPTPGERSRAAAKLAGTIGCPAQAVDEYLHKTWRVRHDGTLSTVPELAHHLVSAVGGRTTAVRQVTEDLYAFGCARLATDATVLQAISHLRDRGLRLGVLSDASAEIAHAWPTSQLGAIVNVAVFSCTAGATKPDPRLYARIRDALKVPVERMHYVGDGGGDELNGALAFGMSATAVRRRGRGNSLAFGATPWPGPVLDAVEELPIYLARTR